MRAQDGVRPIGASSRPEWGFARSTPPLRRQQEEERETELSRGWCRRLATSSRGLPLLPRRGARLTVRLRDGTLCLAPLRHFHADPWNTADGYRGLDTAGFRNETRAVHVAVHGVHGGEATAGAAGDVDVDAAVDAAAVDAVDVVAVDADSDAAVAAGAVHRVGGSPPDRHLHSGPPQAPPAGAAVVVSPGPPEGGPAWRVGGEAQTPPVSETWT